jgi:hypothetical protein
LRFPFGRKLLSFLLPSQPSKRHQTQTAACVFGAFLSTLFLMLTNPITIAVFTALFAGELLEAF